MPGFNVADAVTCRFRGVDFVGRLHLAGMQKPRRGGSSMA